MILRQLVGQHFIPVGDAACAGEVMQPDNQAGIFAILHQIEVVFILFEEIQRERLAVLFRVDDPDRRLLIGIGLCIKINIREAQRCNRTVESLIELHDLVILQRGDIRFAERILTVFVVEMQRLMQVMDIAHVDFDFFERFDIRLDAVGIHQTDQLLVSEGGL